MRERRKDAGPAADAFVKRGQIVFLVRRMDAVVVEPEADQQRIHAEHALELGDDGNRGAGTDEGGVPAPFLAERTPCGTERRHAPIERDRWSGRMADELSPAVGRQARADESAER